MRGSTRQPVRKCSRFIIVLIIFFVAATGLPVRNYAMPAIHAFVVVTSVTFSPKREYIGIGQTNGHVFIWSTRPFRLIASCFHYNPAGSNVPTSILISELHKRFTVAFDDGFVGEYGLINHKMLKCLRLHTADPAYTNVILSSNGHMAFIERKNNEMDIIETRSGIIEHRYNSPRGKKGLFSNTGKFIAIQMGDFIRIVDTMSGAIEASIRGKLNENCSFSLNDRYFVCPGPDIGKITIWHKNGSTRTYRTNWNPYRSHRMTISPAGDLIAVSGILSFQFLYHIGSGSHVKYMALSRNLWVDL